MSNDNNGSNDQNEPIGARGGEIEQSERSDPSPSPDPEPDGPDDSGGDWTSEIAIALALVGGVLLLAGLLFVGLGGLAGDGGDGGGAGPAGANTSDATPDQESETNDTETEASNGTETTPDQGREQEDGQEPAEGGGDSEASGNGGADDDPTQEEPQEPEPDPEPEEPEEPEPEPDPEPEPGPEPNETRNESEPIDQPATAVIRVTRPSGQPVVGEPVAIADAAMEPIETRTTDANGEVRLEGTVDSADEVITLYATVGAETHKVILAEDETHGVQEVVVVLQESDSGGVGGNESAPAGNATNATNETVAVVVGVGR